MFWDAVIGGLEAFTYGDIWLAIAVLVGAQLLFLSIIGLIGHGSEIFGGVVYLIFGFVLNAFLLSAFIFYVFPIVMSSDQRIPLSMLFSNAWLLIKVGLVAAVAATILSFIPIIGLFLSTSHGAMNYVEGIIIFHLITGPAIAEAVNTHDLGGVYPSIWAIIGYLVVAGALGSIALLISSAISITVSKAWPALEDTFTAVIALPLGLLAGIPALFMYISHVSLMMNR